MWKDDKTLSYLPPEPFILDDTDFPEQTHRFILGDLTELDDCEEEEEDDL